MSRVRAKKQLLSTCTATAALKYSTKMTSDSHSHVHSPMRVWEFCFNNRTAHYIKNLYATQKKKTVKVRGGMAYEKIKDCVYDIDGALSFLRQCGYRQFYLIGESTGANKICVYNHYKPRNTIKGYILFAGGDDTGIYYQLLGKQRFSRLLTKAQTKIRSGNGAELILELLLNDIFSYQSFYDIASPDGDYNVFPFYEEMRGLQLGSKKHFSYFQKITKPTLVVYGGADEYCWEDVPKCVDILKKRQPHFTYHIIPRTDHACSNHQSQLAQVVAQWLKKN